MIEYVNIQEFACVDDLARDGYILYTYMENVVWESLTL